tara:strand:+ start:1227 stop:1460 length:234 start_codon:yes stop_codon:yes gene_type:complete
MNLNLKEKTKELRNQGTYKCVAINTVTGRRQVLYSNTPSKVLNDAVEFAKAQSNKFQDYEFSKPVEIFKLSSNFKLK